MSTDDSNQPHTTLYRSSPTIQALHAVPQALTLYPRWVPVQGRNPNIGGKDWQHRAGTLQHAASHPDADGVGFYLGENDLGMPSPVTIVDFDGVMCDGHWHSEAEPLITAFYNSGVYLERSLSGIGVHAIVQRTDLPDVNGHALGACKICGRSTYEKSTGKISPIAIEWWGSGNTRQVVITGDKVYKDKNYPTLVPLSTLAEQIMRPMALNRKTSTGRAEITTTPAEVFESEDAADDAALHAMQYCSVKINAAMMSGDFSEWDNDGSRAIYAIALALIGRGKLSAEQCLDVMMFNEHCAEVAERRRAGAGARDWMWQYVVSRAAHQVKMESGVGMFGDAVAVAEAVAVHGNAQRFVFDAETTQDVRDVPVNNVVSIATGEELTVLPTESVARDIDNLVYLSDRAGSFLDTRSLGVMSMGSLTTLSGRNTNDLRVLVQRSIIPSADRCTYDPLLPPRAVGYDRRSHGKVFNTYNGLAVAPYTGADAGTAESVQPWLDWVAHIVPDPIQREEMLNFFAAYVQGIRMNQALVLFGERGGEGKGFLVKPILDMFGSAGGHASVSGLMSDYTEWRHNKQLVYFREGLSAGKFKRSDIAESIKEVIDNTSGWYSSHIKYESRADVPDCLSVIISANNATSLPLDGTDRKFFLVHCTFTDDELFSGDSMEVLKNRRAAAFAKFEQAWIRTNGDQYGLSRLLAFLQARDLTARGFGSEGAVVDTAFMEELREQSLPATWQAVQEAAIWAEANDQVFLLSTETRHDLCNAFYAVIMRDRTAVVPEGVIKGRWGKVCRFSAMQSQTGKRAFPMKQNLPLCTHGVQSIREYMNGRKYPRAWEEDMDSLRRCSDAEAVLKVKELHASFSSLLF